MKKPQRKELKGKNKLISSGYKNKRKPRRNKNNKPSRLMSPVVGMKVNRRMAKGTVMVSSPYLNFSIDMKAIGRMTRCTVRAS